MAFHLCVVIILVLWLIIWIYRRVLAQVDHDVVPVSPFVSSLFVLGFFVSTDVGIQQIQFIRIKYVIVVGNHFPKIRQPHICQSLVDRVLGHCIKIQRQLVRDLTQFLTLPFEIFQFFLLQREVIHVVFTILFWIFMVILRLRTQLKHLELSYIVLLVPFDSVFQRLLNQAYSLQNIGDIVDPPFLYRQVIGSSI